MATLAVRLQAMLTGKLGCMCWILRHAASSAISAFASVAAAASHDPDAVLQQRLGTVQVSCRRKRQPREG